MGARASLTLTRLEAAGLPETRTCEQCGGEFRYDETRCGLTNWRTRRFCSEPCRRAATSAGTVTPTGAASVHWKGDNVSVRSSRERIEKLIPLDDAECESCGEPATVRHHRDENPRNNARENIALLCRSCHHWLHQGQPRREVWNDRRREYARRLLLERTHR